jgi:glutamyl-tRNA reductase
MKAPKIDLDELKKIKEQNFKERLEFIDKYSEWIKKNTNKKWSSKQRKIIH